MLVMFELKDDPPDDPEELNARLGHLDSALDDQWPKDRLITPDDVVGDHGSLRDAIAARGWPPLAQLRGSTLFMLHVGGRWRDAYTHDREHVRGRRMFPDGRGVAERPYAAVHAVNDPVGGSAHIASLVDAGHLVRTRADSDGAEARAGDTTRLQAALAVGAHFISSDFPTPHPDTGYQAAIPGGTPSGCNPRTAPRECTHSAIEAAEP